MYKITTAKMLNGSHNVALKLATVLIALVGVCHPARAEEFCALTVNVLSDGRPARIADVRLIDPSGKTVFDRQVEGPEVRICDFGFGPHKVVIGRDQCSPTTISDLRLRLGHPIHLTVQLNMCSPDVWGAENSCRVYLRVHQAAGLPIMAASVRWTKDALPAETDQYGRVEFYTAAHTAAIVNLTKDGYLPESLAIRCERPGEIEREITLRGAGRIGR